MQCEGGPSEIIPVSAASTILASTPTEEHLKAASSATAVWPSVPHGSTVSDNSSSTDNHLSCPRTPSDISISAAMLINGLEADQPISGESSGGYGNFGSQSRPTQGSGGLSRDTTCDNTPITATPNNEPASQHSLSSPLLSTPQPDLAEQMSSSLASQLSGSGSTPLEISSLNIWSSENEGGGGVNTGDASLTDHSHYIHDLHGRSSSPSPYFGYESPDSEASSSHSASYTLSYGDTPSHSSSQSSSSVSASSLDSEEQSDEVDSSSDSGTHEFDDSSGLSHGFHGSDSGHQMDFQTDSDAFSPHHGPDFTVQIDVFPDENGNIPAIYIDHGNDDSSADYDPEDGEGENQTGDGSHHNHSSWTQSNGTQTTEGGVGVGTSYGLPDTDDDGDDNSYNDDDDEDDDEDNIVGEGAELDDDDYEDDFDDEAAMDISEDQEFYMDSNAFTNPALLVDINGLSLFPNAVAQLFNNANAGANFLAAVAAVGQNDDEIVDTIDPYGVQDFERNSCFADFCKHLSIYYEYDPVKYAEYKISQRAREVRSFPRPSEITAADVAAGYDLQGIPWDELEIERERARRVRNAHYSNYANLIDRREAERLRTLLPNTRKFYRFRRTDNKVKVRFNHFQLRNLLSVSSKNDIFYTGNCQVLRYDSTSQSSEVTMDLWNTTMGDPIKITTIAGSNGVLLAGGFNGEYAMKALDAPLQTKPVDGIVTSDNNGITNHIHVFATRTSGAPHAVFSSNDMKLRILDCTTNTFVAEHSMNWAINCSATSPCGRLRAIVGDAKEVVITDSERGTILTQLPGHLDYGFACAWAEDGYTIATGNQDMMVRIYDARNFSRCVASIDAEIAGVRTLRFSPLGSGPRVLAMAEPADFISIVDAVDFETQQKYDIFGEIGGIGFAPDSGDLFVANSDRTVGGLMEFERQGEGRIVRGMDWLPEENLRPGRAKRRRKGSVIEGPYLC